MNDPNARVTPLRWMSGKTAPWLQREAVDADFTEVDQRPRLSLEAPPSQESALDPAAVVEPFPRLYGYEPARKAAGRIDLLTPLLVAATFIMAAANFLLALASFFIVHAALVSTVFAIATWLIWRFNDRLSDDTAPGPEGKRPMPWSDKLVGTALCLGWSALVGWTIVKALRM